MRTFTFGLLSTLVFIGCSSQTEVPVADTPSDQLDRLIAEFAADTPTEVWAGKFLDFAEANASDQAGVDALLWITQQNRRCLVFKEANDIAIDRLVTKHPGTPETAVAIYEMRKARSPKTAENLKRLASTDNATLRGLAIYGQAYRAFKGKRHDEAKQLFQRVLDEHAGLSVPGLGDRDPILIQPLLEQCIFEMNALQIGMEAPDIVAIDIDGVEFKLSDYRGKVVLLSFWGDW